MSSLLLLGVRDKLSVYLIPIISILDSCVDAIICLYVTKK